MSSGTRRAVATSADAQARHEGGELDLLRLRLERGELTMREAQEQLVELVLHRTADFPEPVQDRLRALLLDAVESDPYFQLAREVTDHGAPERDATEPR